MPTPNLVLSRRAKLMIRYAVQARKTHEIQGFGQLERSRAGDLWVTDIIIPPQEVMGASVDTTPKELEALMLAMAEQGQVLADWPLWWHSHAKMGVFASGTDTGTLSAFSKEFGGVAVGLVTNADDEYYSWYAGWNQMKDGTEFFSQGKLDVLVETEQDEDLKAEVAEYMEHVKVHVPTQLPGAVWMNGQKGSWINGKFIPDKEQKPLSKKEEKRQRRKAGDRLFHDEDTDEELEGYYAYLQAQYADDTPQHKMSKREFKEYIDKQDAEDVSDLDGLGINGMFSYGAEVLP